MPLDVLQVLVRQDDRSSRVDIKGMPYHRMHNLPGCNMPSMPLEMLDVLERRACLSLLNSCHHCNYSSHVAGR